MEAYVRYGINTTDDSKEGIARYLIRNPNTCFVAEENGEIVGVIMSGHDGRRGFTIRNDLIYRNKNIHKLEKIDLI